MKRLSFGFLLLLISAGCRPEGELTRTLHKPHQKYLDRRNPASQAKVPIENARLPSNLERGLPPNCRTASSSPLCINCEDEGLTVYRCFNYSGPWSDTDHCHHTPDAIKCLVKDPPFALFLEHKHSDEKFFKENLKIWVDKVHEIWSTKLSPNERMELGRIVASLDVVQDLVTGKKQLEPGDVQRFQEAFDPKSDSAEAELYLRRLTEDRKTGALKLSSVIRGLKDLTQKTHGSARLFEKFGTMSLEGLED